MQVINMDSFSFIPFNQVDMKIPFYFDPPILK